MNEASPINGNADPSSHRAPAVARAAMILRMLASERTGLGVTEIARRVGIVPSTCLHVLRALVDEGFITFDKRKKTYRTGVGLLTLVRDVLGSNEFPRAVQPILDDLATKHQMTAVATEIDSKGSMVVVAIARCDSLVSLHIGVGNRFPPLLSAIGRCVAAASGLDRAALRKRFDALRSETTSGFDEWYSEVERARSEGVAIDRNTYIRGITIISSVIRPGIDRKMRGISLIGFEHAMTERIVGQLREDLLSATHIIRARLS